MGLKSAVSQAIGVTPSWCPQGSPRDCHQRCSNLVLMLLVKAEAGSMVQVVFFKTEK